MNHVKLGFSSAVIIPFLFAVNCFGQAIACPSTRVNIEPSEFDSDASVLQVAKILKSASEDYLGKVKADTNISTFVASCKILEREIDNSSVTIDMSEDEFLKQKNKRNIGITDASESCLHGMLYALDYEKKELPKDANCSDLIAAIDKDIANISELKAINDKSVGLINKGVDPDKPIKNFTPEQLQAIAERGDFSSIASEKPYYSILELGISFMPEYDEDGDNNGFKESNFFGVLRLNNRMQEMPKFLDGWVSYQGLEVAFYSAPVACTDKNTSEDEETAEDADSDCGNPELSVDNIKFKDISNTVNASVYASLLYNRPAMGNWEAGFSARSGVLNREKKGADGDSVARFHNYGIEMRLNDFGAGKPGSQYLNGAPKFIFNYSEGSNEDFAGTGIKTNRKLASFNYRLFDNQPVFVGLIVDGGKGPDTIALNLSYGIKASSLFGLFTD